MSGPRYSRPRRNASQGGDLQESDRLRPLFLVWIGRRSYGEACRAAGLPADHIKGWINAKIILADRYQKQVRELLDRSGVEPSPCS